MPAFPRLILPKEPGPFQMPGALASWGDSGLPQHRATVQMGRTWTETYKAFQASSPEGRAFLAFINDCWRNGKTFDIEHYFYLTRNGTGGPGAPLVNGANQTGSSLVTDGWTPNLVGVLKAGDIIRLTGVPFVRDVLADVNTNGTGQATLTLNPPLFPGGSPADNVALTITGVRLNARLLTPPALPASADSGYIAGLQLTFREVP